MKKTLLVVSVMVVFALAMGFAYAQEAPKAPEAPAAPAAPAAPEAKPAEAAAPEAKPAEAAAPAAPAATEEVVVGKIVEKDGKFSIAVEGKDAVAVKADAKLDEVKKVEKFNEKTFEFKGTFATEKVKEGEKEVEVKLFVIASFAEKAAEAPKDAPKPEEKK